MESADLRERVLSVVADMAPLRGAPVGSGSTLRESLGYDSLALLELAAALEDEFGLPPSAELDAEDAETVADIEQIVLQKLQESLN
ncbi:MAG TPA: phosphopantetheine-binding protein [Solirubrobacteraceae bacterium]|jgi:acyl carrier protein|nr:phosphopantetheine-binding protein [Solirubrobacteraceae bacterium]